MSKESVEKKYDETMQIIKKDPNDNDFRPCNFQKVIFDNDDGSYSFSALCENEDLSNHLKNLIKDGKLRIRYSEKKESLEVEIRLNYWQDKMNENAEFAKTVFDSFDIKCWKLGPDNANRISVSRDYVNDNYEGILTSMLACISFIID